MVQVTIAGVDDGPIEITSDLYRNLRDALRQFGDPQLPLALDVRERLALVISAKVRVAPDYAWEFVEPAIRAALLDAFGFDRVALGDDLLLATAIRTIQSVAGVAYTDVDVFATISEADVLAGFAEPAAAHLGLADRLTLEPARMIGRTLRPAQLAYLTPDVPDTLILQEIVS